MVSALWPMQTRFMSAPASFRMSTCWRPTWRGAHWCVLIGQPVSFDAIAAARRMISAAGETPSVSEAHLMTPALMPVSWMPTVISRTKIPATCSGVIARSWRGTSRQMPVATTMWTPLALA